MENNFLNSHQQDMLFQTALGNLNRAFEYQIFSMLKPKLYRDGNQWCVLYGEDIASGIAGFGESPYLAILDFNKSWHERTNS